MTLKEQVTEMLKIYPETRNSDITLMITLWQEYYPQRIRDGAVLLGSLYDLPREDNIKRIRAQLNALGRYLPTDPEVLKQRGIEEDKWREELGYPRKTETYFPTRAESTPDKELKPQTLI